MSIDETPPVRVWAAVALAVLGVACSSVERRDARVEALLAQAIVVDTHIDAPTRIERSGVDLSVRTSVGQFDLERAREGRLGAAFMSIFVPAGEDEAGRGLVFAERQIDHVEALVARAPDRAVLARCTAHVREAHAQGRIALALGLENGGPLAEADDAVERLAARGIRYVTLAHSRANAFSDSSSDPNRRWGGLSADGEALVRRLNQRGIMVDVSHLSDDAVRRVLEVSAVPPIASHSGARRFTPGYERNLDDGLIRALAERGGVVQVYFGTTFVTAAGRAWQARRLETFRRFQAESGAAWGSAQTRTFLADYGARHPAPSATLDDVLDHFDHVVELVGARHVGIGSDFDGVEDLLPAGLADVSAYPNLVRGLVERGYSDEDIRGLLGENLLRVWAQTERFAEAAGQDPCG